jgi:Na+-transporting methylmalonyl-CoA/oxaloacetate decarboxylase gamma subunit
MEWAAPVLLAANPSGSQPGGQGQEFGSASPIALVVLVLFFVAVAFLARSMSKHLKRVPTSFEPTDEPKPEPTDTAASDQKAENAEKAEKS